MVMVVVVLEVVHIPRSDLLLLRVTVTRHIWGFTDTAPMDHGYHEIVFYLVCYAQATLIMYAVLVQRCSGAGRLIP